MSVDVEEKPERASHVVVHDDLRALFRARRKGSPQERFEDQGVQSHVPRHTPAEPEAEHSTTRLAAKTDELERFSLGPSVGYRLRCDGRRPVVFEGIVLLERSVETPTGDGYPPIRQEFSLYLSTEGKTYARIAMMVPEGTNAFPLRKVSSPGSAAELDQFLHCYDPAEGWSWLALGTSALVRQHDDLLTALRNDFGHLVKAALGAAPIQINS
ncbi:MAG: hypothetical protein AAGC81_19870 [Pseudomonadota bacterium]